MSKSTHTITNTLLKHNTVTCQTKHHNTCPTQTSSSISHFLTKKIPLNSPCHSSSPRWGCTEPQMHNSSLSLNSYTIGFPSTTSFQWCIFHHKTPTQSCASSHSPSQFPCLISQERADQFFRDIAQNVPLINLFKMQAPDLTWNC